MPFLARRIKGPLWAKAAGEAKRWEKPEFPYELLADLIDKDGSGISVWEVSSKVDPALTRIAAALVAGNKKNPGKEIQSVEFRLIPMVKVEALGIAIRTSPGDTEDSEMNKLHRELIDVSSSQAIALLRLMNQEQCIFTSKEIAKYVSRGIVRKHLAMAVLTSNLLWSLYNKNAVKIVIPKASQTRAPPAARKDADQ